MKTASQPIWPRLITFMTLVTVLMLSACGGSPGGSSVVISTPTSLGTVTAPGAGATPGGSPVVIAYDDGSVFRFSGSINNAGPAFQNLANVPGPNSSVKLMATYEYNGQHYLMVAEGNNDLYLWNGTSWQNYKITAAQSTDVAVTQMVSYNSGVVVGLADGEVWQLSNNSWIRLHDWGFNSPVAQMVVNGNNVAIVLGDAAIFQMIATDTSTCASNQGPCWTDLKSPANVSSVSHLISYVDNSNHSMLAIALSNGAIFTNDGSTTWTNINNASDSNAKVTQMLAFSNPNSLGQNSLLIGCSDGRVFQWNASFRLWTPVLAVDGSAPITQLSTYNDTLIVGYQNKLTQVQFKPGNVIEDYALAGSGWEAAVTQVLAVNNQLIVSLQNGAVKEWDGNANYNWIDLALRDFTPQQLTSMAPYKDQLVLGFGNGSVVQWNDPDNPEISVLHDNSWGSSVVQLVNWNNNPAVALANGAVESLQNNSSWFEYESPAPKIHCPVSNNDTVAQMVQLLFQPNGNELLVGLSQSTSEPVLFTEQSSSVVNDLTHNQMPVSGSEICVSGFDSEDRYKDEIAAMIAYSGGVYVGYNDGGTVRGWDGISTDGFVQIHDAGWTNSVSTMSIFNKKLVVGLTNGAIEQWNGDGSDLTNTGWTELHDSSFGLAASQMLDYNGTLVALFANSAVLQYTGGNLWSMLAMPLNQPVTQIAIVKGELIAVAADGTLLQYNNSLSIWSVLPAFEINSAVNQIVDNGNLIVGYANGSFAQWDGTTWTVFTPHAGHAITQMMAQ